jgi:hypothetical protein
VAEQEQGAAQAVRRETFFDKLGPTLSSALIVALLSATSLGAVALRDMVVTTNVDLTYIKGELARVRVELDDFKRPGGRFTKDMGDDHKRILDDHERRLREQEARPPRLNTALEKHEEECRPVHDMVIAHDKDIQHIIAEQGRLCSRLQACKGNSR